MKRYRPEAYLVEKNVKKTTGFHGGWFGLVIKISENVTERTIKFNQNRD